MNVEKQNSLFIEAHENAMRHGFWEGNPSAEHFLCLVLCELAEAVDAKRKCLFCSAESMKFFEERIAEQVSPHEAATEDERYYYWFENYVKNTLGDELADAYIRLCDLAGAYHIDASWHHGMNYDIMAKEVRFTENVLALASLLTDDIELYRRVLYCMEQIERLAELEKVDLEWHIKYKMRFNKLRQYKHGRAF